MFRTLSFLSILSLAFLMGCEGMEDEYGPESDTGIIESDQGYEDEGFVDEGAIDAEPLETDPLQTEPLQTEPLQTEPPAVDSGLGNEVPENEPVTEGDVDVAPDFPNLSELETDTGDAIEEAPANDLPQ